MPTQTPDSMSLASNAFRFKEGMGIAIRGSPYTASRSFAICSRNFHTSFVAAQSHSDTGGVPAGRTVGQMAVGGKDSVLPRQIGGARLLGQ